MPINTQTWTRAPWQSHTFPKRNRNPKRSLTATPLTPILGWLFYQNIMIGPDFWILAPLRPVADGEFRDRKPKAEETPDYFGKMRSGNPPEGISFSS